MTNWINKVIEINLDPGDRRQKKTMIRIDTIEPDTSGYNRFITEWYFGRYA